ncbi:MAG: hypothetical protein ABIW76_13025 [Fibrobacteria bacterium]
MRSFASLPLLDPWNPFQIHWIYAMEERGWRAEPLIWWPVSLFKHRKSIPVIVFHFPNAYWRTRDMRLARIKAWVFRLMFILAKRLGYKLVWVANNVLPHDALHPQLELTQRRWMLDRFDLVIGVARNTRKDLEAALGPFDTPFVEGVHGHYEGLYPPTAAREDLIRRFGFDASKLRLLLVLSDKPYKGHSPFLEAWTHAETKGLQLVVAGKASPAIAAQIKVLPGDVLRVGPDRRIAHYEMGDLLHACDMVALPYLRVTTSGAYFLALTMGRPVLAPDLPFFKSHTGGGKGIAQLYPNSGGIEALRESISALARTGFSPDTDALLALKKQFTWRRFAEAVAPAFDALVKAGA